MAAQSPKAKGKAHGMISGLYITAFSNRDEGDEWDGSSLRSCSTFHVPGSMYNVKHQTSNLKPDFRLYPLYPCKTAFVYCRWRLGANAPQVPSSRCSLRSGSKFHIPGFTDHQPSLKLRLASESRITDYGSTLFGLWALVFGLEHEIIRSRVHPPPFPPCLRSAAGSGVPPA